MVVVPINDALVVVLYFFNGRSWHAVAAVGVTDPGDFFAQAIRARNTTPLPSARNLLRSFYSINCQVCFLLNEPA